MPLTFKIIFHIAIVFLLLQSSAATFARDTWKSVDRIVAIGDLHGDYEQFRSVMTMTKLIDDSGAWIGGKTHLVQTGDIPDRGPDSLLIIRDLQALQKKARKAKGYVHLLIGNHESMNIYGDLRYVHPGEYIALRDKRSAARQLDYYQRFIIYMTANGSETIIDDAFKTQWMTTYPLGYVEHRVLWQPGGELGRWARKYNTVIKINDVLFVHGGINPHQPFLSIREINKTISEELGKSLLPEGALTNSEEGPLWYRGLANNPEESELPALVNMLEHYEARHIVVGHTTTRGVVIPRFDSRVISIDVGLASQHGNGMAALLIENGQFFSIHRGTTIPLPATDDGLKEYFEKIEPLEPNPDYVQKIIRLLEPQPETVQ